MECCVHVLLVKYVTRQCNYFTLVSTLYIPLTQTYATPLFIASQNGHSNVVNILIRNGADINLACQVMWTHFLCYLLLILTSNRDGSLLTLPDLRDTLTLSICWKEGDIDTVCPGH